MVLSGHNITVSSICCAEVLNEERRSGLSSVTACKQFAAVNNESIQLTNPLVAFALLMRKHYLPESCSNEMLTQVKNFMQHHVVMV